MEEQIICIEFVIGTYLKKTENVLPHVTDGCNTNKYISRKPNSSLIGDTSQK